MISITLRNIPDEIAETVRLLAQTERRSLNQQFIVLLEQAVAALTMKSVSKTRPFPKEVQIEMWKQLSGKWKDSRSTTEIVKDIYLSRTKGRKVSL